MLQPHKPITFHTPEHISLKYVYFPGMSNVCCRNFQILLLFFMYRTDTLALLDEECKYLLFYVRVMYVCVYVMWVMYCRIPKKVVGWERKMSEALTEREVLNALAHLGIAIHVHSNK